MSAYVRVYDYVIVSIVRECAWICVYGYMVMRMCVYVHMQTCAFVCFFLFFSISTSRYEAENSVEKYLLRLSSYWIRSWF